ncbi:efflux transporter outer membrane subunit [Emcibacter sp. SYSU 3D8]|uniref:efflux transporter outer membrane subunit n=1 Tax=Emcibacter sp. SYSU 3D8 TaxID=3133969 RepID=UPI0031FEC3C1
MKRGFVLIAAVSCVLAGCVPTTQPKLQMLQDAELGLDDAAAPVASKAWWRDWADPQFEALVVKALSGNPRLAEALARVRAAQASAAATRGDALPRVTLDGDEQFQRFSERFIYPPPYGGGHYWLGSVQSNLSWDVDFWGRQKALIDQSRAGAAAVELDAAAAQLALTGTLAEAYIGLDRAYALLDIAERAVAQRARLLDLAQRRVVAGLDSRIEEKQAEGQLAVARVARQQAINERDNTVHAIAALTGQGAGVYADIVRPTLNPQAVLPLPETLPADLLARRPDILAARLRVGAAMSGQKAAKAAFYPNVNLVAFAGFQAIGLSHLLSGGAGVYGAGPAVHLPLFDARLKPNYEGATAEIDIAIAGYNGAVVAAVQQVADRLSGIHSLRLELVDQAKALEAAEQAFALAERRYGGGLSTYLAVLTAETQLLDARRQLAVLTAQQALERVKLLVAVGGDFAPPAESETLAAGLNQPAARE